MAESEAKAAPAETEKAKRPKGLKRIKRWLFRAFIVGFVLFLMGVAALALFIYIESKNLPELYRYEDYRKEAVQMSKVVASDGSLLYRYYEEQRRVVPKDEIPKVVKYAVVAAEDADFYNHPGIDLWGIFRATIRNLVTRRYAQGGSTITQQVTRTFHLTKKKTIRRKIRELILAYRLEDRLEKDEIMALYLNQIYFGHGRYGIEEASQFYFGRSVRKLGLAEAALLAGVIQSPERLSPYKHPKRSLERRRYVLQQLIDKGFVDADRGKAAMEAPLGVLPAPPKPPVQAPYFVDVVRRRLEKTLGYLLLKKGIEDNEYMALSKNIREQLSTHISPQELKEGLRDAQIQMLPGDLRKKLTRTIARKALRTRGLIVETTLSPRLQGFAEYAVQNGLARFDVRQRIWKPEKHFKKPARGSRFIDEWAEKNGTKLRSGRIVPVVITEALGTERWLVETPGGPAILVPGGSGKRLELARQFAEKHKHRNLKNIPTEWTFKPGDLVRAAPTQKKQSLNQEGEELELPELHLEMGPQAAFVAIEHKSREVQALVGGSNAKTHPFNRAVQARRQAGSSFKPIVYSAALEEGLIHEKSLFSNTPETYRLPGGRRWTPSNYNGVHDGKLLSFGDAVANSVNVVAVQVLSQLKVSRVIELARRMGIQGPLASNLTLALGSAEVTPLELTNAMATLPAEGLYQDAIFIRRIRWPDGHQDDVESLWRQVDCDRSQKGQCEEEEQVLSEKTTRTMTRAMREVVRRGTARKLRKLKRVAAGKTGTTNGGRNLWFVGFTPEMTAGALVAYDDRRRIRKGTGGAFAAPIWLDFMQKALEGIPEEGFGAWLTPLPTAESLIPKVVVPEPTEEKPSPEQTPYVQIPSGKGLEAPPDLGLDL